MMREKTLSGLLVGALLFGGCTREPPSGITRITYNCAANATDIARLQQEIPAFAESTRIEIALQPFTGQEKLYAMMAAGDPPDIFYTNSVVRDRLAAEGRLLDLRGVSAGDPFLERLWSDVYRQGFSTDGGLYSIGNWSFTAGIYYNKDLFDRAGLRYPDTSWTWSDLLSSARRLTGKGDTYGIFIPSHFAEMLEQMNGAPVSAKSLFLTLSPESIEALRLYLALMTEHLMPNLRRVQALGMQASQLLQTGKVAMLMEAVPHQGLIETLTIRWGIAPVPRFGGKPIRYFRSESGGLSLSATTTDPKAAWKAVKWIIAGASAYQPNPVLKDVDFVSGWEARYPQLARSGFREVWEWSLKHPAGDPRFFVRFSSWTSAPILERLQPLLDRLWAGEVTLDDLTRAVPGINLAARAELERAISEGKVPEKFLRAIKEELVLQ